MEMLIKRTKENNLPRIWSILKKVCATIVLTFGKIV